MFSPTFLRSYLASGFHRRIAFLAGCLACLLATAAPAEVALPASYNDFKLVTDFPSLAQAIKSESFLLIPPGEYEVENPIVIDRDRPLYLLGFARQRVHLKPKHLNEPMFLVKRAPYFKCAYFSLGPDTVTTAANTDLSPEKVHGHRGFLFQNTSPIHFEWQGMYVMESVLEIQGPGQYFLRSSRSRHMGVIPSCLMIDHPQAEVYIHGDTGMTRATAANSAAMEQYSVIWKKRGHLEIQTAGGEQTGHGLVQIDTPSPKRADILTHIRSEGTKEHQASDVVRKKGKSVLLYVPKTNEKVNVLLQCSRTSVKPTKPPGLHTYADYNGAGTLWLLGNNSKDGIGTLVEGEAPEATIVAMGNSWLGNKDQIQASARRKLALGNMQVTGNEAEAEPAAGRGRGASYRESDAIEQGLSNAAFPAELEPPVPAVIPPAEMMLWTSPPPESLLVSVAKYGAKGDGRTDDTAALQSAIDHDGWRLFFPAGKYLISKPLGLNNRELSPVTHKEAGGWWSGSGADRTVIENTGGGSVFISNGIAYYKFEGLTFQTKPYGDEPCVAINNVVELGGVNCKAQHFTGCRFIGGSIAFGLGLKEGPQVDFHCLDRCSFEQAKQGFAIGCFNNVQEMVQNSRFVDNEVDCGHTKLGQGGGGNAGFYNCTTTGNRAKFVDLGVAGTSIWYFNQITGTVPEVIHTTPNRSFYAYVFDGCHFTGRDETQPLITSATGCLFFNHSRLNLGRPAPSAAAGPSIFVSLFSKGDGLRASPGKSGAKIIALP